MFKFFNDNRRRIFDIDVNGRLLVKMLDWGCKNAGILFHEMCN